MYCQCKWSCFSVLAMQHTGNMTKVYPASHPVTVGIGSSPPPDHPNYPNLELDKQKKNGLMELLQRVACTTLPHNHNTAVVRGLHPLMERPSQNLLKIYGLCLNTVSVPDLN